MEVTLLRQKHFRSKKKNDFTCLNCKASVEESEHIGTRHRNHCPVCLYSKHVDLNKSGDRKSLCKSKMKPIGLTFKKEAANKYGGERVGELMLVHRCCNEKCRKVSINRLAGDDDVKIILNLFEESLSLDPVEKERIYTQEGIKLLTEEDREEVESQLFGNKNSSKERGVNI